MFTKSATAIFRAARELVRNWQALSIMTVTYALLLTGVYIFVTTKEATTIQVVVTVALAISTPVFFFVLQTASADYTSGATAGELIAGSIKNSWKLFVVSLPVIAVTMLGTYLLLKLQTRFSLSPLSNLHDPIAITALTQTQSLKPPIQWGEVALVGLRYLLIGLFAPLALIHLWISISHNGLSETLRQVVTRLTRAFAARSVLIYMAGFVVFALVPYFVLFKTIPTKAAWLEIGLLAVRLAVVFCLTLFGWVVTVGALALAEESIPRIAKEDAG